MRYLAGSGERRAARGRHGAALGWKWTGARLWHRSPWHRPPWNRLGRWCDLVVR
ncbi:hypothetical protein LX15_004065 [Streptoalloteichus tenebrarius]|uniref:Uncharacterized protein n=1 Tax=Streptoalloteichus tenebrarius (strain ATCC 17920 / DSM 40477 / JCM 4838 / CBS 697.72 / NBRC 16177 / NCIMB 11028 / NRRL B-12390 / A12253. 1 / ISP 5477) TaxID=1933 RepID=A0ABT1HXU6_STRSD|nr:hypothetical protein [Streptoalloteichus tenebrarius]